MSSLLREINCATTLLRIVFVVFVQDDTLVRPFDNVQIASFPIISPYFWIYLLYTHLLPTLEEIRPGPRARQVSSSKICRLTDSQPLHERTRAPQNNRSVVTRQDVPQILL